MGLKMKQVAALLQGSPRNWLAPPRGCHCSHSPPCLSCIPFHTAALAPSGCALGCQGRWSGWLKLVLSQAVLTFHRLSLQISPGFEVEQAAFPSFSIPNVHWSRVFTCKPYKCATAHSFTSLHFKRFPCILEEILPLGLSEKRWFFFFYYATILIVHVCAAAFFSCGLLELGEEIYAVFCTCTQCEISKAQRSDK